MTHSTRPDISSPSAQSHSSKGSDRSGAHVFARIGTLPALSLYLTFALALILGACGRDDADAPSAPTKAIPTVSIGKVADAKTPSVVPPTATDKAPTLAPAGATQTAAALSTPLSAVTMATAAAGATGTAAASIARATLAPTGGATLAAPAAPLPVSQGDAMWQASFSGSDGHVLLTRSDREIDFNWRRGSPGSGVPIDGFSATWTRRVYFAGGDYRFLARVDDGMRLSLDGQAVLDTWNEGPDRVVSAERAVADGMHTVRVDYFERAGDARIKVWWEDISTRDAWRGEYYANRTLSGAPQLVRNDSFIDFDWGEGAPAAGLPVNDFSVRWTRNLRLDGGTYRFRASSDDGIRVRVGGKLVIGAWRDADGRSHDREVELLSGIHPVEVEYYERGGRAMVRLSWERISSYSGWKGEYWANRDLSGTPALVRDDDSVDFSWGDRSPASGLPADDFSARWTKRVRFDKGEYRIYAQADDGVRVSIDGERVIDRWHDGDGKTRQINRQLDGRHEIKVEYYENRGQAKVRVWWERVRANSTATHTASPPPAPTETPTLTAVPPTVAPLPTSTLVPPTDTPEPTETPVAPTPEPPTETPEPPTETPEPTSVYRSGR